MAEQSLSAEARHYFAALRDREAELPRVREEGAAALVRLAQIVERDTGQSSVVARFLLGLYNGPHFPFDLTELRRLDYALFDDCMLVLKMDFQPEREVHLYLEDGEALFARLAVEYGS